MITFNIDILCSGNPVLDFTFCVLVDKDGNSVDNYARATENGLEPWMGRKSVVGNDGDMLTNVNQKEWYQEYDNAWIAKVFDTTKRIDECKRKIDWQFKHGLDSSTGAGMLMDENQRDGHCHCKSVGIDESSFLKDLRDRCATVQAASVGAMDEEAGWEEDGSFDSRNCPCPLHLVMSFHIEMEGGSGTGKKKRARQTAALRKPVILLNEPRPSWVQSSATDGVDLRLEWRTNVFDDWQELSYHRLLFDPSFELTLSPEGQPGEATFVRKVHKDDFLLHGRMNFKRIEQELSEELNNEGSFMWKEDILPGLLELWNADAPRPRRQMVDFEQKNIHKFL